MADIKDCTSCKFCNESISSRVCEDCLFIPNMTPTNWTPIVALPTPVQSMEAEAKELVEKFRYTDKAGTIGDMTEELAKQCALIHCDLQIELINKMLATGMNNDFDLLAFRGNIQKLKHSIDQL